MSIKFLAHLNLELTGLKDAGLYKSKGSLRPGRLVPLRSRAVEK